jgi:hypothetical protein
MYYSKSLPTRTYTTEIGDFEVSDLSSYLILENSYLEEATTDVSSNTTLLELSNKVYSDLNLFWYFLYANDTINPFNLLDTDTSDLLNEYNTNTQINSITVNDGFDIISPAGSIILPFVANSGQTWDFGYTGNFSLTGGFGFVKEFDTFTKVATIIQPYGGITFGVNNPVSYIIKGSTYSFKGSVGGETRTINYVQSQAAATKEIKYQAYGNLRVYALLDDDQPPVQKGSGFGFTGSTLAINYKTYAQTKDTNIKYFVPYTAKSFQFTKIVQNYVV